MHVNDVINVQEIQQKIDKFLIELKDDEIEIFVSPGTPAMQTAWYFWLQDLKNHFLSSLISKVCISAKRTEFTLL